MPGPQREPGWVRAPGGSYSKGIGSVASSLPLAGPDERFSNFATRGDIQLMNVQLEEMQNIFASSLQMAKNTMHTIESTLASHSYVFDSFRSDYISHESVPGGSIMNFLHLIREHVDIGDNHVRDVLTNEVGLQLKQLQDRVEQVNERVDDLQVLCESKLREYILLSRVILHNVCKQLSTQ